MQPREIIGTWRLQEYRLNGADGAVSHPWGPGSVGFLLYTEDGHWSATLKVEDTRTGKDMFQAVCGAYKLEEDKMTHIVVLSSNPDIAGTEQLRKVWFEQGAYVLSASPSIYGGPGTRADLVWRRTD